MIKIILFICLIYSFNSFSNDEYDYLNDLETDQMSHYERKLLYDKNVDLLSQAFPEIEKSSSEIDLNFEEAESISENYDVFSN